MTAGTCGWSCPLPSTTSPGNLSSTCSADSAWPFRTARALIDVTPAIGEKLLPDIAGDLVRRELDSLRQVSIRRLAENAASGPLLEVLHDRQWPGVTPHRFTDAALQMAYAAQAAEPGETRQMCQELVVWLSFYSTVLDVFGAERERLITHLKERNSAFIDDLAATRYAMRVNAGLAHLLIEQYRLRNEMGRGHGSR